MVKTFTDLVVWQESHKLSLLIYRYSVMFPNQEIYGLTTQMRRAAVLISSNIAEGFGRFSDKDQEHFYIMASGSLYELKSQLIVAFELHMIKDNDYLKIMNQIDDTHRLLNGLIRAHKRRYSND